MPKEGKKKKSHKKKAKSSEAGAGTTSPRQTEHVDGEEFKCTLPGIFDLLLSYPHHFSSIIYSVLF